MSDWRLIERGSQRVIVGRLELAASFWSRLAGLQFRRELPADAGLLLVPCNSVHTCCVRFELDVVQLDRAGQVLRVVPAVRPWRLVGPVRGAWAVLELPAGSCLLQAGDWVGLAPSDTSDPNRPIRPLPASLTSWRSPAAA